MIASTTNRLADEKSPYLLQHAHNPVDWYPWGEEAFNKAKSEDKPIFLSIGYSTCHWCHVMERESFEDDEVAEVLNNGFVAIKVDREERPDVDQIYMNVCQALNGSGGWPLTIIMTSEQKPFFAATYLPKTDRMGMKGLISTLDDIKKAWNNNRKALLEFGSKVAHTISKQGGGSRREFSSEVIDEAFSQFKSNFDVVHGGFGEEPKFPTPHNLMFLMRYWYKRNDGGGLEMITKTLDSMHRGGIYDHIGYGFSRYSTDREWLVPHFEKMLYDNALLAYTYTEAFKATGIKKYADVASEIFTYILRDMTSKEGGFYCAEDADSEGIEGKFYVWSKAEVMNTLGKERGEKFCKYFDITDRGNFENENIPNLIKNYPEESEIEFFNKCKSELFKKREIRIHPYKDDKILTSWNGLMIAAMAYGGRSLKNSKYISAAENAVKFIFNNLVDSDGRLLSRYRDGEAGIKAYADDYAFLVWGLIELYESTYKAEYLKKAVQLNDDLIKYFWDEQNGGLFLYGSDSEQLISRPKEIYDGAIPSANSVAALNFIKLSRLTGKYELENKAQEILNAFGAEIESFPMAYSFSLLAVLFLQNKAREITIVSERDDSASKEMLDSINEKYDPFSMVIYYIKGDKTLESVSNFLREYNTVNGKTTAYICENFSCSEPVTDVNTFRKML